MIRLKLIRRLAIAWFVAAGMASAQETVNVRLIYLANGKPAKGQRIALEPVS